MDVHEIANSVVTAYTNRSSGDAGYLATQIKIIYAAVVEAYIEAQRRINES